MLKKSLLALLILMPFKAQSECWFFKKIRDHKKLFVTGTLGTIAFLLYKYRPKKVKKPIVRKAHSHCCVCQKFFI